MHRQRSVHVAILSSSSATPTIEAPLLRPRQCPLCGIEIVWEIRAHGVSSAQCFACWAPRTPPIRGSRAGDTSKHGRSCESVTLSLDPAVEEAPGHAKLRRDIVDGRPRFSGNGWLTFNGPAGTHPNEPAQTKSRRIGGRVLPRQGAKLATTFTGHKSDPRSRRVSTLPSPKPLGGASGKCALSLRCANI